jgi:hypothetical protein
MRVKKLCLSLFAICLAAPFFKVAAIDRNGPEPRYANATVPSFMENRGQITDQSGQTRTDIDFKLNAGNGLNVFIGHASIHYQWRQPQDQPNPDKINQDVSSSTIVWYNMSRMDVALVNANPRAKVITEDVQDYYEHYYLPGNGKNGTTVKSYKKITYKEVWPGIDWVLYIRENKVEYDFVVRPNAKVSDIRLKYSGSDALSLNKKGELEVAAPMGRVKELAPRSFQQDGKAISSSFRLNNDELSFATAPHTGTLIIDPTLEWATYYGGTDIDGEMQSVASDHMGNVYLTSKSLSLSNIATTGAFQTVQGGLADAIVVKFNKNGARQWATYFGGAQDDKGIAIAYDHFGRIYVAGTTKSISGVATTGAYQTVKPAITDRDVFLARFDTTGNCLWSTYYGGIKDEDLNGIACDEAGHVYIIGTTSSNFNIVTPGAFQGVYVGPYYDGYLAKFDSTGAIGWSTYYGGAGDDFLYSVAVSDTGTVYCGGYTTSSGMSTPGAQQTAVIGQTDAILVKFNGQGQRIWATYYGGTRDEATRAICTDDSGNVYMTGSTRSKDSIATPGCYKDTLDGGSLPISAQMTDGYLVKYDSAGVKQWSTYYGGVKAETPFSLISDPNGNIYIGGTTSSLTGIATPGAYQTVFGLGFQHTFIAKFTPGGTLSYGTYYGGTGYEFTYLNSIAMDREEVKLYFTGFTNSTAGISTTGSYQPTFGGGSQDVFLAKFCFPAIAPTGLDISGSDSICADRPATYTAGLVEGAYYIWLVPSGWTGSSTTNTISVIPDDNSGTISVMAVRCDDTTHFTPLNVYVQVLDPVITVNEFVLGTAAPYPTYQWMLNGTPINGATNATYTVTVNGAYQVIVSANGCTDTSAVYNVTNVTGINTVNSLANLISVYPNPATDMVTIISPVPVNADIADIEGRVISSVKNTNKLSLSSLTNGIYLLRITDKQGTLIKVEKVVKQTK